MGADRGMRRWIGLLVLAGVLAAVGWIVPRLLPRSPVTILLVCGLAVVTMKLVKHRVGKWFRRFEARHSTGPGRPPSRP